MVFKNKTNINQAIYKYQTKPDYLLAMNSIFIIYLIKLRSFSVDPQNILAMTPYSALITNITMLISGFTNVRPTAGKNKAADIIRLI